ncbi:MAG: hypothetical protein O2857_26490 [Planctomycetota bacterium]|nr:hypothetical protein [Planctomycetota bacterium]
MAFTCNDNVGSRRPGKSRARKNGELARTGRFDEDQRFAEHDLQTKSVKPGPQINPAWSRRSSDPFSRKSLAVNQKLGRSLLSLIQLEFIDALLRHSEQPRYSTSFRVLSLLERCLTTDVL